MFIWKRCLTWTAVLLVLSRNSQADIRGIEPGQCLSKFDYDYRVMQKMLQLERDIQELKEKKTARDIQQVAFMAQLSANLVNPSVGTTVVFDVVHTNVGDGYKPGPGIFVAPVTGTYSVNLVASSGTKSTSASLHLYIMHNTSQVGYIFLDQNRDRWLLRATTAVLKLNAEDTVYVKIGHKTGSVTLGGCCFHTHFSGFLINQISEDF